MSLGHIQYKLSNIRQRIQFYSQLTVTWWLLVSHALCLSCHHFLLLYYILFYNWNKAKNKVKHQLALRLIYLLNENGATELEKHDTCYCVSEKQILCFFKWKNNIFFKKIIRPEANVANIIKKSSTQLNQTQSVEFLFFFYCLSHCFSLIIFPFWVLWSPNIISIYFQCSEVFFLCSNGKCIHFILIIIILLNWMSLSVLSHTINHLTY